MIRGGLRTRLVVDSFRVMVVAGLTERGWFDTNRSHQPLHYRPAPTPWDERVTPNVMAITAENIDDVDRGFGGEVEDTTRVYVDVYGESDSFAFDLARDVRDLLEGRLATTTGGPVFDVYDLRQPTPASFTSVEIEGVVVDRARSQARPWEKHWWMVRAELVDDYGDEATEELPTTTWTEDLRPAWDAVQVIEVSAP